MTPPRHKQHRGFARMSIERRKEVAAQGGVAAHKSGNAHEFDTDEAKAAGKKGGMAARGGRGKLPDEQQNP